VASHCRDLVVFFSLLPLAAAVEELDDRDDASDQCSCRDYYGCDNPGCDLGAIASW
jgi:hypothetical protein